MKRNYGSRFAIWRACDETTASADGRPTSEPGVIRRIHVSPYSISYKGYALIAAGLPDLALFHDTFNRF